MANPDDIAPWWASPPPSPYSAAMSEFTTPGDLRRERIASAFGRDPERSWWDFLGAALTQAPLALRAGSASRTATPRATAAGSAPAAVAMVQEYIRRFGHQPPSGMSSDAMHRWIYSSSQTAPRGGPNVYIPPPTPAPTPVATAPPARSAPVPMSAREDLYAMSPHHRAESHMSRWDDPVRAQTFMSALDAFQRARPPPASRLNSLAPVGLLGSMYDWQE